MVEVETRTVSVPIARVERGQMQHLDDCVAIEEPLEIRLEWIERGARVSKSISITMRTPGNDEELAIGFLVGERVITRVDDVDDVFACAGSDAAQRARNVVKVRLAQRARVDWPTLERHFYATSSCGVCGKSSLAALEVAGVRAIALDGCAIDASVLHRLPALLRSEQSVFEQTGGLHAAGLFTPDGALVLLREDVGRHNALDKVIGAQFMMHESLRAWPLSAHVLCLSGRASFELVQKAAVAGIAVVAAVGAPSSLAIDLAERMGITLVGFLRAERFNIYSHALRVRAAQ